MVYSMIFSGITSVMGALVMAFCAGDWETYMVSEYDSTHLNRLNKADMVTQLSICRLVR